MTLLEAIQHHDASHIAKMISDRDIWTTANEVIKAQDDPILFAVTRYDELLDLGDMEGCVVWRRIEAAIRELLNEKPDGAMN